MSYVQRSYATSHNAFLAVKRLKKDGYRTQDIRLIVNEEVHDTFIQQLDIEVVTKGPYENEVDDDASLWEKIKDAFSTVDDYGENSSSYENSEEDPLFYYRADIDAGKIIVLVKETKAREAARKKLIHPSYQS